MLMRRAILSMPVTPGAAVANRNYFIRCRAQSCGFYVSKYSEAAAETWACGKGATEAGIKAARNCLKGEPVRTAQSAQ
jgi:hypothetical protein